MRKLKLERKWARGSWRILARAGGGICRVGRTRGREKERESRLRVAYTGRRKSAGSRQGLGVGRPRLSAIKIIPFLLAAERKELTSTLSRVAPPRGATLFLFLPPPVSTSSPPPSNSSYSPLSLSSSLVVALVSIAILIVSSYARMTNPHGTVRNERATLFFSRCGRRSKTSSMRLPLSFTCPRLLRSLIV